MKNHDYLKSIKDDIYAINSSFLDYTDEILWNKLINIYNIILDNMESNNSIDSDLEELPLNQIKNIYNS